MAEKTVKKTTVKPAKKPTPKEPDTAKAGKRSAKALREADEKAKKATKKPAGDDTPKKGPKPKVRPHAERKGKAYKKAHQALSTDKPYELAAATKALVENSTAKFDATVEIHIKLNVDPKQSDQNIRGSVTLPHGSGKERKIAVFASGDDTAKAKEAGADLIITDTELEAIKQGKVDFDMLIAAPDVMPQLGRYAKVLGPKGLMPNPKSGTVTKNVHEAVKQAKAGKVEFRVDPYGIIHMPVGKVSFGAKKLAANINRLIDAVTDTKPPSVKGEFIDSVHLATTMGPSLRLDV